MIEPFIIVPRPYAKGIVDCSKRWGTLTVKWDPQSGVAVVDGFSCAQDRRYTGVSDYVKHHYLAGMSNIPGAGFWYHVDGELHAMWLEARMRQGVVAFEGFKERVKSHWNQPSADSSTLIATYADLPGLDSPHWLGWIVDPGINGVRPCDIEMIDEDDDLLAPIAAHWPLDALSQKKIVAIGAGSIGSAACEALASYGVRRMALVDPDRLRAHNFARHRVSDSNLGRYKVDALADHLKNRDSRMDIDTFPIDVVFDADLVRAIVEDAAAVLVTSDGVESRRAANHLARRAGLPTVFACVLLDGAFGEVVRVASTRRGCLDCLRRHLQREGGFDPEPSLDRGYGLGNRHLPMTAVGGDLNLVGTLAAKSLVATLLQQNGHRDQRLPGSHAVIGLRPKPEYAVPLDFEFAGEVRWHELPEPCPDCVSCRP